jgi:hypothetical protein
MFEAFVSTQQFGNLNYDVAEDHNQAVNSHMYNSAVNFYEEFDFNNLNQPLPVSDENIFEFVDFDHLLPTGDHQRNRSTRPEEPTEVIDLITPADQV